MGLSAPERVRWAVEGVLAAQPRCVVEVGCGHGLALALLAPHVPVLHGVDRSATAVAAARRRVPAVPVHQAELADLDLDVRADVVLAVRVNLFWTRDPAPELAVLRRLLAPGGALHLVHDAPGRDDVGDRVLAGLARHGVAGEVERRDGLVRVVASNLGG